MKLKPGTLVQNLSPNSKAKLFSRPLNLTRDSSWTRWHPPQYEIGFLNGTGIVLGSKGSDLHILSDGISGWCFAGNVTEVK